MNYRFPISASDQARIIAGSVQVTDVAGDIIPPGLPYPQSSVLRFRVSDPATAVKLIPLGPGTITFIPDMAAGGALPQWNEVVLDQAHYDGWPTRGTLLFTLSVPAAKGLRTLIPPLEIVPTRIWYARVRITREFLEQSLLQMRAAIKDEEGTAVTIPKNHAHWHQHAIARFLAGRFDPMLKLGTGGAEDDVVRLDMPVLEPDAATGEVSLAITAAAIAIPRDGPAQELNDLAPVGMLDTDPRHPMNGVIPARHVYRALRPHLLDAAAGTTLPDAWLAPTPAGPNYVLLRFTRIYQPLDECSVHFPKQRITVEDANGRVLLVPLPHHGLLFVPDADPAQPLQDVTVTVEGGMRLLLATMSNAWRVPANDVPLDFSFDVVPQPHIIIRRTMGEEVLRDERRPATPANISACTYFSLRRVVRALIDHRISGGRLNYFPNPKSLATKADVIKLIEDAWAGTEGAGSSSRVKNDLPSTKITNDPDTSIGYEEVEDRAVSLIPILNAFFPDLAPAQLVDGALVPVTPMLMGEVFYHLWQTILPRIKDDASKRNFPRVDIGCGGPGAAHAVGLASYVTDPDKGEASDADYRHRLASSLATGLEPGGLIQFWLRQSDFEMMRTRAAPAAAVSYGHSPICNSVEHVGDNAAAPITGLDIIDHHPPGSATFTDPAQAAVNPVTDPDVRLMWGPAYGPEEIWIGANWNE